MTERDRPALEHCPACASSCAAPVGLLDLVDEGLYLLAIHCASCDRLALGVYEDADVERYERVFTADVVGPED
jgi:hypothetical protein